jgi:RNA polymerase sigma-70 factor (ECF subfamily)
MEEALAAPAEQAPDEAGVAFEALYRSSRDDLYAYLAGMLRDRDAAEEATAVAFERAWRRRRRYDPRRGTHRAWLFGIARNAALDELRRRRLTAELLTEPVAEEPSPEDQAEAAIRRTMVRQALAGLSPRERELISLKYFAGLSHAEIAAAIGVSETNAGTRLNRAVNKLREACDEAHD